MVNEFTMSRHKGVVILKAPAGVGKTHSVLSAVQAAARQGSRVLWAGQDHNAWGDLSSFPAFDPDLWLHWQGLLRNGDDGEPICRFNKSMDHWLRLGYPARDLCMKLCAGEYMEECPYWQQVKNKAPCTFGQHAHLCFGVPVTRKFSMAVIDELPVGAFVKERFIPWRTGIYKTQARLKKQGLTGETADLIDALVFASYSIQQGAILDGRALFDQIGPSLDAVFHAVDAGAYELPVVPDVASPGDVWNAEYWFLPDLLLNAAMGHKAWSSGWDDWAHRVWADFKGLHILGRHSLWDDLPEKVMVMDATAQVPLYKLLLRESIKLPGGGSGWRQRKVRRVYSPTVKRAGKLYQVTGRLNSKKSLYKVAREVVIIDSDGNETRSREIEPQRGFWDAVSAICEISRARGFSQIGLVTYKAIEKKFAEELSARGLTVTARHFYNVRGTNSMIGVEALFVVGTPTPRAVDLIKLATALDAGRQLPFVDGDKPIYRSMDVSFPLTTQAMENIKAAKGWDYDVDAVGRTVGVYSDPTIRALHDQFRAAELEQACHRARVNINATPVFILTATPLIDEPLDGIWDDPQIGPDGIPWRTWILLRDWLDSLPVGTQVGASEIADALDLNASYIRNKKWVDAIVAFYAVLEIPEELRWRWPETVMQKGRGRPRKVMGRGVNGS